MVSLLRWYNILSGSLYKLNLTFLTKPQQVCSVLKCMISSSTFTVAGPNGIYAAAITESYIRTIGPLASLVPNVYLPISEGEMR